MCTIKAYRIEAKNGLVRACDKKYPVIDPSIYPISISFISEAHALYYFESRPDCVWKEWEMQQDWWDYVQHIRFKKDCKESYIKKYGTLSTPTISDGKKLSKYEKDNALTFDNTWSKCINDGVCENKKLITKEYSDVFTTSHLESVVYVKPIGGSCEYYKAQYKNVDTTYYEIVDKDEVLKTYNDLDEVISI